MSFLNAAMLFGALACAAPLLIHLLNRSRFQTVDWGAMHLLDEALQVNSRRLQWESWLLLLMRCSIPILFAICLARPVLNALQLTDTSRPQSIVFVLDDTLSMQNASDSGTSFSAAQEIILAIADQSPAYRNSQKVLITTSGQSTSLNGTTTDNVRLNRAVRTVTPGGGNNQLTAALQAAASALEKTSQPTRQLVLLSDFRNTDWATVSQRELEQLSEKLQSATEQGLSTQISLIDVGQNSADNLAVTFPTPEDYRLLPTQPKQFQVSVQNFGEELYEGQLEFSVEGQRISSQKVSLAGGERGEFSFACQFPQQGWYTLSARLAGLKDSIPQDNQTHQIVHVVPPLQVLLVSEKGESPSFNAETDFIQLALAPFDQTAKSASSQSRQKLTPNQFEIRHIATRNLNEKSLQAGYDFIILAGISRLKDSTTEIVTDFVEQGGGLLVLPGEKMNDRWYKELAYEPGLLPYEYGDLKTGTTKLLAGRFEFAPLQVFNSGAGGDLSEIEFNQWRLLQNIDRPQESSASDQAIALQGQDGDPLIVAQRFGKGRVIQFGFACTDDWSNLPLRPAFVPLLQQLAFSVSQDENTPNVTAGDRVPLGLNSKVDDETLAGNTWSLQITPDEASGANLRQNLEQPPESQPPEILTNTQFPGTYRLALNRAASAETNDGPKNLEVVPPRIAVRPSQAESDTRAMSQADLAKLSEALGAQLIHSADEFQVSSTLGSSGREIWRWFLVGLLALLFAEILLGKAITKGAIG